MRLTKELKSQEKENKPFYQAPAQINYQCLLTIFPEKWF